MKKNEITSNVANVTDLTIQIRTGALTVANAKKSARAEADRLLIKMTLPACVNASQTSLPA